MGVTDPLPQKKAYKYTYTQNLQGFRDFLKSIHYLLGVPEPSLWSLWLWQELVSKTESEPDRELPTKTSVCLMEHRIYTVLKITSFQKIKPSTTLVACSARSTTHVSPKKPQDPGSEVAQPCPTVCDPMDYTVHGILQARILEWVVFLFSRGSSQPRNQTHVSRTAGDSSPAEPQGIQWALQNDRAHEPSLRP